MIYFMNICLALIAAITLALLAPRRARLALSIVLALAVVGVFTLATALDAAHGYVDPALHSNWDKLPQEVYSVFCVIMAAKIWKFYRRIS